MGIKFVVETGCSTMIIFSGPKDGRWISVAINSRHAIYYGVNHKSSILKLTFAACCLSLSSQTHSQGKIARDSLRSNSNQNENSRIREQLGDKAFNYNW